MKVRALVVSMFVAVAALPQAPAVGAAPPAACSLLTQDEVVAAFDAPIGQVGEQPTICTYGTDPLATVVANLVVELRPGDPASSLPLLDQARVAEPSGMDLTVGGVPALQGPIEAGPTGGSTLRLHLFPDATTWVVLTGDAPATGDIVAVLTGLAEQMLPRLGVVAPLAGVCDLWSVAQVSAALGGERMRQDAAVTDPRACRYEARGRSSLTELAVGLGFGRPEDGAVMDVITQNYPDALPVALSDPTVAMLHTPPQKGVGQGKGYLYHTFFLVLDPTTLIQIQVIAPKKVDAVAALAGLVEGALPAMASLGSLRPPEPTPTPSPEPVGDIATLFPTEIGGKPVEVEPEENRLVGQPVRAVRKLVGLLKKQDRTLDGFRFAIGSPGGTGAIILVVQLPGGRMAPLEGALRDALGIGGDGRSTTIAGKGVRVVEPYHTYVKGDALWVVTANGAELEEIFQKLP